MSRHRQTSPGTEQQKEAFMQALQQVDNAIWHVAHLFADGQSDTAQDLYQDIIYELYRSFATFRRESDFSTWAYRVALNEGVRHLRRRLKAPPLVRLHAAHADCVGDDPYSSADPLVDRLYSLIARLGEADRSLVALYLEGLSQRQMADVLRISENAVKQRMKRIRQHLIQLNHEEEDL